MIFLQATQPPPSISIAQMNADPAIYERLDTLLAGYLRDTLKDPHSASVQRRGSAFPGMITTGGGLLGPRKVVTPTIQVCYTVNAKNSYGGFTGAQEYLVYIHDGDQTGVLSETPERSYASDYVNEQCTPLNAPTKSVELYPERQTPVEGGDALLALVADGKCDQARQAALAANDGTALLQVEKLCKAPVDGK